MKKRLIIKDKKRRLLFVSSEMNCMAVKYLLCRFGSALELDDTQKTIALNYLFKIFSRVNSKTRVIRHCVLTGRSRGSNRFTLVSRIKFKEMIRDHHLKTLIKASW